ncbi:hypothetical protein [Sorangium cellulosum]|uniref:Uncharacterized protein n=1 Tax=Sorangium cellulosum TaxID=56 RepID=A0A150QKI9_SORCE|nr:hypothetical protein [Sorangium cellulosum]KYF68168.1 hypothetical protein BE15_16620 [Sorangium cellulosum]
MDIKPTQAEIDKLATKLDELSEVLTETERGLLLAIISIAGQSIAEKAKAKPAEPTGPTSLPRLSDAFKSAFKAGVAARYEFEGEAAAREVSVGGATVTWTN